MDAEHIRQLSEAHMLRTLHESKVIRLTDAEIQYARAAEEYLVDRPRLSTKQRGIIYRLYAKYVKPLMEGEE